jgi:DNA-binding protein H-NS
MRMTQKLNLEGMSIDEMWRLHEEISAMLSVRLTTEKRELEKRLAQLRRESEMPQGKQDDSRPGGIARHRRHYPQVLPKYRNPEEPSETWSGRGKQPRWLAAALKAGHKIEDFLISQAAASNKRKTTGRRQRARVSRA